MKIMTRWGQVAEAAVTPRTRVVPDKNMLLMRLRLRSPQIKGACHQAVLAWGLFCHIGCSERASPQGQRLAVSQTQPHQDEWWPHCQPRPMLTAGPSVCEESEQYAEARELWFADRPSEAIKVLPPSPHPLVTALRGAILRRLGEHSQANTLLATQRTSTEVTINHGWLLLMYWLRDSRGHDSLPCIESASLESSRTLLQGACNRDFLARANLTSTFLVEGRVDEAANALGSCFADVELRTRSEGRLLTDSSLDAARRRSLLAVRGMIHAMRGSWLESRSDFQAALLSTGAIRDDGAVTDPVQDAGLLLIAGAVAAEAAACGHGRPDLATTWLHTSASTFASASKDCTDSGRRSVLEEQARRAYLHLAVAKHGCAESEKGRTLSDVVAATVPQASRLGELTWFGLLTQMVLGKASLEGVLRSIPASLPQPRRLDLETQARLFAAILHLGEADRDEALRVARAAPPLVAGCDRVEAALLAGLVGRLTR